VNGQAKTELDERAPRGWIALRYAVKLLEALVHFGGFALAVCEKQGLRMSSVPGLIPIQLKAGLLKPGVRTRTFAIGGR
jgi:hypothetical protein